jgi:hypothetical protein
MRLALLALATVAALALWRRRRTDAAHVVVGWRDGAELELPEGTPAHRRIVATAEEVLR